MAIMAVWLIMLVLLVHRLQVIPEIDIVPGEELADNESWMSIYFQNQKVGYAEQTLAKTDQGYTVNQNTYLRMKLMGQVQELRTLTSARLTEGMGLMSFNFFMSAGPVRYQLSGRMNGLTLELNSTTGGYTNQSSLELDSVPRLASGVLPYVAQQGLKKGQRFKVPVFDPATLSTKSMVVAVEDSEKILIEGQEIETYRIRQEYLDTQSYTWVDTAGRPVKEEGLLGLSMVRTTEEKAFEGLTGKADLTDVVEATSAPVKGTIDHPREVRQVKVRLSGIELEGFELDGGRQKLTGDLLEITREKIDLRDEARLPIQGTEFAHDLLPTTFIQSRDPKIMDQAKRITAGNKSPLKIIGLINDWVYDNLEKRPTMSVPSAVDVLETKVGDCNEHAVLAAALLRASGIPTRVTVGALYYGGRFYYHAWLEVYWGQWMAIDPLLGQLPADASHLRFVTGGLARQSDMIRVIGRLQLEVLEAK
jgi:hypothetical protein